MKYHTVSTKPMENGSLDDEHQLAALREQTTDGNPALNFTLKNKTKQQQKAQTLWILLIVGNKFCQVLTTLRSIAEQIGWQRHSQSSPYTYAASADRFQLCFESPGNVE